MKRREFIKSTVAATIAHPLVTRTAAAELRSWPQRPVTLVVPIAPGGAVDYIARLIAGRLADKLGKPFVVENRQGAGMVNGTASVARTPADGYTLVMGTSASHAINATLYKRLPYDPVADFTAIAHLVDAPFTLVVNPSLPVGSISELAACAKTTPLSYASTGAGTPQHLLAELLKAQMGIEMTHVPYRGNVLALADVVAGHVQVMFSDPSGVPMIRDGKVRALGVSSKTRIAVLPDTPPLAELDLPGFNAVAWMMLFARNGTPRDIIDALNAEIKSMFALSEIKDLVSRNAMIPVDTPPVDALRSFVASEIVRWGDMVRQAGIAGSQ